MESTKVANISPMPKEVLLQTLIATEKKNFIFAAPNVGGAVFHKLNAGVVELVDTPDLGSGAARCGSSSLPARTLKRALADAGAFFV